MHPWHDISAFDSEKPEYAQAFIEIPRGSRAKYELDKDSGFMRLDRVLSSAVFYPANYGFFPQTYCDDKDPLDVLLISQVDIMPSCLVPCRIIGVMHMVDGGEMDDKILAVTPGDPAFKHVQDLSDIPQTFLDEIRNFFETYKLLEKKSVEVSGFSNKAKAEEIFEQSLEDYKKLRAL
jgi:inorganic pyrophosphatase